MSNYITVDNRRKTGQNADLQYIMPMVAGEVAQKRKREDATVQSMNTLYQDMLINPDMYKEGTNYNVQDNGLITMNDKAQAGYATGEDFSMEQKGINESNISLDTEANDNMAKLYNADKKAKEEGAVAQAVNKIANGTSDMYTSHQGLSNTYSGGLTMPSSQSSTTPGLIAEQKPDVANQERPLPANVQMTAVNGIQMPTITENGTTRVISQEDLQVMQDNEAKAQAPVNPPVDPAIARAEAGAEIVKGIVKDTGNPKAGVSIGGDKNAKSKSNASSMSTEYSRDVTGASSELDFKLGTKSTKTGQSRIVDQDRASIKQLRHNAVLENSQNAFALINSGIANVNSQANDRLKTRQEFIDKHMAGFGVKATESVVTAPEMKYKNIGGTAKESQRLGASTQNSMTLNNTSGNTKVSTAPEGGANADNNGGLQGTLRLGTTNMQGTDTGKRSAGGNPIMSWTSPAGYTNAYNDTKIGKLIKTNAQSATGWLKQQGATDTYNNNDGSHNITFSDGQYLKIYKDGSYSSELDQRRTEMLLNKSSIAGMGKNAQTTDETVDQTITQGSVVTKGKR